MLNQLVKVSPDCRRIFKDSDSGKIYKFANRYAIVQEVIGIPYNKPPYTYLVKFQGYPDYGFVIDEDDLEEVPY